MDIKRQKIIELIHNMSKLSASGSGAFQGEIEAASAKIQELMEKYSIQEYELNRFEEQTEMSEAFTDSASKVKHKSIKEWHWRLARLVARVTITKHYAQGGHMMFYGSPTNTAIAADLYAMWVENIENMSAKAKDENFHALLKKYQPFSPKATIKWMLKNVPDEEDPKYYRSSWITGCITGMTSAVQREEMEREMARKATQPAQPDNHPDNAVATHSDTLRGTQNTPISTSGAIVLATYKEKLEIAFTDRTKGYKTANTSGSKGFSYQGYAQGKATGSNIHIGSKALKG